MRNFKKIILSTLFVGTLITTLSGCTSPAKPESNAPKKEAFSRNFWKESNNKYVQYNKLSDSQKKIVDDIYNNKTDAELKADKEAFDKESPTIMKAASEIMYSNSGGSDTLIALSYAPMALYHAYTHTLKVEKPEYVGYYLVALNDETWWMEAFSGKGLAADTMISNASDVVSAIYKQAGITGSERTNIERAFSQYKVRPADMGTYGADVAVYTNSSNQIVVEVPTVLYRASDKNNSTIATKDGKPFMVAMRWLPTAGSGINTQRDHVFGFTVGKDGENGFAKVIDNIIDAK